MKRFMRSNISSRLTSGYFFCSLKASIVTSGKWDESGKRNVEMTDDEIRKCPKVFGRLTRYEDRWVWGNGARRRSQVLYREWIMQCVQGELTRFTASCTASTAASQELMS